MYLTVIHSVSLLKIAIAFLCFDLVLSVMRRKRYNISLLPGEGVIHGTLFRLSPPFHSQPVTPTPLSSLTVRTSLLLVPSLFPNANNMGKLGPYLPLQPTALSLLPFRAPSLTSRHVCLLSRPFIADNSSSSRAAAAATPLRTFRNVARRTVTSLALSRRRAPHPAGHGCALVFSERFT